MLHALRQRSGVTRLAGLLLILGGLIGLGTSIPVGVAVAAPEPEPVPERWELDIRPGPLRVLTVDLGDDGPQSFAVFTYEVVNNSGEDLFFAPWFELATDEGALVRAGRGVPLAATEHFLNYLGDEELKSEIGIQGRLLQGEEHGRQGIATWPFEDLDVDEVTIFLSGFSGETRRVLRPDTGEEVTLRKTLMLRHITPGEIQPQDESALERTVVRWVMR
ncbi:MAG: hypothetical protein AAGI30_05835 [Planctomycetota bacterium]